jgi:hypothetical protein
MSQSITVGSATILYAAKAYSVLGIGYVNNYQPPTGDLEAGWVLPGGYRVTKREDAVMAAQIISNLMEKSK